MAGGSTGDTWKPTALMEPQWSPGLMAGGSSDHNPRDDGEVCAPQWSPGLMAGGRKLKGFGSKLGGMAPQWSPGLMAGGSPASS